MIIHVFPISLRFKFKDYQFPKCCIQGKLKICCIIIPVTKIWQFGILIKKDQSGWTISTKPAQAVLQKKKTKNKKQQQQQQKNNN